MEEQDNTFLVQEKLTEEFNIQPVVTYDEWFLKLASAINTLIRNDFSGLVNILYRLDVNEKRLKDLLKQEPATDAGELIAQLVVERQLEKLKWRKSFDKEDNIPDDEKW